MSIANEYIHEILKVDIQHYIIIRIKPIVDYTYVVEFILKNY